MKSIILFLAAFFCITSLNAQNFNVGKNTKDSLKILLQKEKQDTGRVMLLTELAYAFNTNNRDTTIILALEALSLSQRIGFVKGQAASLIRIGSYYNASGNRAKAMEVFLKALKLSEKINYINGISGSLNNIGLIYHLQGEYHQAIDYYLKAKKLNGRNNREIATNLRLLGSSYFQLKRYDSAKVYTQQIYQVTGKEPFDLLGNIYSGMGQKKLALEYYRLQMPITRKNESNMGLGSLSLQMARMFESEGQMDSTLVYANQAFKILKGAGFTSGTLNASSFLSSFYERKGNADSAFFYLKIAKAANDSLFGRERVNQLHGLGFDEKLRQIEITAVELKEAEDRKHNLQYAAIAIGLITFIILFFALSRSIIVKTKFIEFFGILGLLAVFEFINLFIHPYLAHVTNDSPVLMLGILIAIGALLIPFHHKLEQWITKIMVEKNKKIRLEAARKTIATLEGSPVT
ncbi:tetratricopeptide repeat protein [Daejeonella sp.]|uniref:tetratricopeptide repeat protein n=1 Tax=Daejeonella sp. TaxID=2805397 RepID=UPI00272FD3AF|nr:tetratricopeptide repeat protein [Daejeonella sp.]MDP2414985.1 tetratricopeptide repeat protein [Daejeonella sp.]